MRKIYFSYLFDNTLFAVSHEDFRNFPEDLVFSFA